MPEQISKRRENTPERQAYMKAYNERYRQEHREHLSAEKLAEGKRIREEGMRILGNVCACCGESDKHFLTLDHIKGRDTLDVSDNGKRRLTGLHAWRLARRLGYPRDKYMLLCYNCNFAKNSYGTCPHTWTESEKKLR